MRLLFPFVLLLCFSYLSYAGETDSLSLVIENQLEIIDPSLPPVKILMQENLSDVSICKGPNHTYYMTGTTGNINGIQDGIQVWASRDLENWNIIGTNNYVWKFDSDGAPWQKKISTVNGWKQRKMISPKIYYFKDTFWITYTNSNSWKSGILKSSSGYAQGPYVDIGGELPLFDGSYASLFIDNDSSVYAIWGSGYAYKMLDDMTGFTTLEPERLTNQVGLALTNHVNQVVKVNDKYILSTSEYVNYFGVKQKDQDNSPDVRNDGAVATANHLLGPYDFQTKTIPHAGKGHLFTDFEGRTYYLFCGDDVGCPVIDNPALLSVEISPDGIVTMKNEITFTPSADRSVVYVSCLGNNSSGTSWENAYTSIQRAVDNAKDNSQIWIAEGYYDGNIKINLKNGLHFYGGFRGNEKNLEERDLKKYRTIITGREMSKHVVTIGASKYIRLDGLIIKNGNAFGESFSLQYGGGMYILGGGETIHIVNCSFENNTASQDGGGLYISVGASPVIVNCTFKNNVAGKNGGAVAIYCNGQYGYHVKMINCIFQNNTSHGNGGAIYFDSNMRKYGLLTLMNCLFTNNLTEKEGGLIAMDRSTNLLVYSSTFFGNIGASQGAVIASLGRVPARSRLVNCIFNENRGETLFSIEGEAEMITEDDRRIPVKVWVEINNSLFHNNDVVALVQRNFDKKRWGTVSNLNESVIGNNCRVGDPAFVDAAKGDFRLKNPSYGKNSGTSFYGILPFDLDGEVRKPDHINIGCY